MVRNFKMRKIAIWNWLFALVIMIAIVWTVWELRLTGIFSPGSSDSDCYR